MNTEVLKRQFGAIGARLRVETLSDPRLVRRRLPVGEDFVLDVAGDRHGEVFTLLVRPGSEESLDLSAVDVQPDRRHLLLLSKDEEQGSKRKFLCGHDERHWFVAAVPSTNGVSRVEDAMEALKPQVAVAAQERSGVRRKDRNRRHNAGFVRQGEWFFIPAPGFAPESETLILRDEPIQRGGGKAHMVEQLYRIGGETVYVCRKHPNGLTQEQYEAVLASDCHAKGYSWQTMRRNPTVYAKGKVRHPDHATIILPFWHLVQLSTEQRAANVAFLD